MSGAVKAWREACSSALRAHSEADALALWRVSHAVEGRQLPVFDYRFEHTLAVVKLGRWLAPLVGADAEVVECAAWLHDCRKRFGDSSSKDAHGHESSAAVEGILAGTDFPQAKIPAVRHAIEHHVGLHLARKLEPIETACLWDCDKLSKLGAVSLLHFACISGAFQPATTELLIGRGEAWMELARSIAKCMNTEPGRVEAGRRLAFVERHYRQLRREWSEPMETCLP